MKLRWHDFTTIHWMDKRDVCLLINTLDPPQEGNFCDEQIYGIKLDIVAVYNHHMGYIDKGDSLANSYSISCWTWKWTKWLFSLSVRSGHSEWLHASSSCGGKEMSHRYSLRLSEEHAGIGWTRMVAGEL